MSVYLTRPLAVEIIAQKKRHKKAFYRFKLYIVLQGTTDRGNLFLISIE